MATGEAIIVSRRGFSTMSLRPLGPILAVKTVPSSRAAMKVSPAMMGEA